MGLVQKAFSDIITFSRSSNATRIGPTGLVEYAPHNLLLRSQDFTTTWASDANRGSITANSIAAPDGTVTASTLVAGSGNFGYRYQNLTIVNTTVYTASCFLKSKELSFAYLELPGGGITYFNLSTGVVSSVGSGATPSITSVGNGWYRCVVAFTSNSTSGYVNIGAANASGSQAATSGSGIYLWGAQLSVGPYALDYTPTTTAAVYGPRFDYDGSGVTIVEPVSTNLLTYSEQFDNAVWTKSDSSITANALTAPDGTVTADKLVEAATTSTHSAFQSVSLAAGLVYTYSVYAKAGERSFLIIQPTGDSRFAYFNLSTGAVATVNGSPLSTSIQSAGNGWYRCTISVTSPGAGASSFYVYCAATDGNASYTGDGISGIYLWGAQAEVGSTATAYMVSGATNGFRAVPVVSGSATPKGLLIEESRTNLLTYSEQFDNAAWTKTNSTVTENATASPDGTVSANLLTATSNTEDVYVILSKASSAITYTLSCFVKNSSNANAFVIYLSDNSTGQATGFFDLSAATVTASSGTWSSVSATISPFGNGWFRCTLTATSPATSGLLPGFNWGNSGSAVFLWGAQLEAGSFATSYIPTLASSVTRSADVASVNTLSPWHNSVEGTLYAEGSFIAPTSSTSKGIATLTDNSSGNDSISIFGISSSNVKQEVLVSGASQASFTLGYSSAIKAATAFKLNDTNAAVNGTTGTTDTSATVPTVAKLQLGGIYNGTTFQMNGWLRRVAFYPRRLLDAELAALTA